MRFNSRMAQRPDARIEKVSKAPSAGRTGFGEQATPHRSHWRSLEQAERRRLAE